MIDKRVPKLKILKRNQGNRSKDQTEEMFTELKESFEPTLF